MKTGDVMSEALQVMRDPQYKKCWEQDTGFEDLWENIEAPLEYFSPIYQEFLRALHGTGIRDRNDLQILIDLIISQNY